MQVKEFSILVLFVFFLFQSPFLHGQCLMVPIPLDQQVTESTAIIEGEVMDFYAFYSGNRDFIFTSYEVKVTKIFNGELKELTIEIIEEGGRIDHKEVRVSATIHLRIGQKATFFLETLPESVNRRIDGDGHRPMYRAFAGQQSIFTYDEDGKKVISSYIDYEDRQTKWYPLLQRMTGQRFATIDEIGFQTTTKRSGVVPSISSFSPTTVTAGTKTQLTINGSGFGATRGSSTVNFQDADDGGASTFPAGSANYISWADDAIVCLVPTGAGTGKIEVTVSGQTDESSGTLQVVYNVLGAESPTNVFPLRLSDRNMSGGITFQYFTDFAGNANAVADFVDMLEKWTCQTGVNFIIGSNTNVDVVAEDSVNVVRFDNGGELPSGVLARVNHHIDYSCGNTLYGIRTEEIDITYNDGTTWHYGSTVPGGGQYSFQTVTLHELGHAACLGHVIDPSKVMHYSLGPATANTVIDVQSEAGGRHVATESATSPTSCGDPPMTIFDVGLSISCSDSIVQLGGSNMVTISPSSLATASVTSCNNTLTYTASKTTFDNNDIGMHDVTITVEDDIGNEVSCVSQVLIFPNIQIVYVDEAASGSGSGADWANAMNKFSDALLLAEHGQINEIKVAEGTYYPDEGYFKSNNDRDATFKLTAGIQINGGYPSGGGVRNPYEHPTILSGEIQQDAGRSNNSYTVMHVTGQTAGAILDGFIIEDGEANGPSANLIRRTGAGMFIASNLDLVRCIIRNNHASTAGSGVGGGIIHYNGSTNIIHCLFYGNSSTNDGGALSPQSGTVHVYNSTFADNHSDTQAGAVHTCNGTTILFNCLFAGNTSGIAGFEDFNDECGPVNTHVYQSSTTANLSGLINYHDVNLELTDPLFLDAGAENYDLRYGSPAVNQGLNAYIYSNVDLDGGPRTVNDTVDLGAHEFDYVLPCGQYTGLAIDDIPIHTGIYRATGDITSVGRVNVASDGPVTFESEAGISLQSEFTVFAGQEFEAKVEDPCVE